MKSRLLLIVYFISHMVQMKEYFSISSGVKKSFFISHMVQMKVTLYICPSIEISIFISHMVQMKVIQTTLCRRWRFTLYPTWFRWKKSPSVRPFEFLLLYIPHGSDESRIKLKNSCPSITFISHMVQMKDYIYLLDIWSNSTFISHMVQMKAYCHVSSTRA